MNMLKEQVGATLAAHCREFQWSPTQTRGYVESGRGRPIIVCPGLTRENSTAEVMLQAIENFFHVRNLRNYVVPDMEAFVVNHHTGVSAFLRRGEGDEADECEISGYEGRLVESPTMVCRMLVNFY